MKLLIPSALVALTIGLLPGEAQAHRRHYHTFHGPSHVGLACHHGNCHLSFGAHYHSHRPRRPRIRISEDCVYKPHKDKVVCKY